VDTVLLTFTLCTIADAHAALAQMRRVLRPGGRLVFCEHGEAPDERVRRWQNRLDRAWTRVAGGCHMNRPMDRLIGAGGFAIDSLDTAYMSGPKVLSFNYWGVAKPA
jgi:SAM-dependent methyltransferase